MISEQELRHAQKELYTAGISVSHAGLRLRNTEYDKAYTRLWNALSALNMRLIKDIKKRTKS